MKKNKKDNKWDIWHTLGLIWLCLGLYCWYFEKGWWAVK